MNGLTPICPYCKKFSEKVSGDVIYPHRTDLADRIFYFCSPCNAYVGAHNGTSKPLGTLANSDLRYWRRKAHSTFDDLWKERNMSRTNAYQWLAGHLDLHVDDCHIAMFDIETCKRVITLSGECSHDVLSSEV